jgi:hypothetical protein
LPTNRAPPDDLCNVRRHRSRADLLKPASHRRLGWHRQDVRGGCRVFDPCWLDQARRWSCNDVARRPRTPPVRSPSFANPLKSDLRRARQGGDRGFESISLQRRVWCEPDFRGPHSVLAVTRGSGFSRRAPLRLPPLFRYVCLRGCALASAGRPRPHAAPTAPRHRREMPLPRRTALPARQCSGDLAYRLLMLLVPDFGKVARDLELHTLVRHDLPRTFFPDTFVKIGDRHAQRAADLK